jgi:hypothetical protein
LISYPLSIVNIFVSFGLLYLHLPLPARFRHPAADTWRPPVRATLPVIVFFFLSNIYLAVAPYVPPETPDQNQYKSLPYWLHCVVGLGIFGAGGVYWLIWAKLLPWIGKYRLERAVVKEEDGWSRNAFTKVRKE